MTTATANVMDQIKIGDFFACSWGYDQTQVDYYEVVGKTKASVRIEKVARQIVEQRAGSDRVAPDPANPWRGDRMTKRVRARYDGTPTLRCCSYLRACLWDGKPQHQTPWGCGH